MLRHLSWWKVHLHARLHAQARRHTESRTDKRTCTQAGGQLARTHRRTHWYDGHHALHGVRVCAGPEVHAAQTEGDGSRTSVVYEYFSPPEFIEWCGQRTKKTKCGEGPNGPDYFDSAGYVCRKQKRNKYTCLICGTSRRQDEPSNGSLTDHLKSASRTTFMTGTSSVSSRVNKLRTYLQTPNEP